MRQVIVLGGNSPKNEAWTALLATKLDEFTNSYVHTYEHWANPGAEIDFEDELTRLANHLRGNDSDYYVVAKSAGALLTLQGVVTGTLTPKALVCIGLPISYAQQRGFALAEMIAHNVLPTIYIQAANDPMGNAPNVAELIAHHGQFVVVPGATHNYPNLDELVDIATKFISTIEHGN